MEVLNAILKRYINFSFIELFLFVFFGIGFYYFFQLSWVFPFLISPTTHQKDINSFPENIFFIILWFLFFFTLKLILLGIFKYIISFKSYTFRSSDWPRKWDYQGNIRLWDQEDDCLYVTDSNSGCILKNHYWKNQEITFKCMFPSITTEDQVFGIIFRAKSLSDYLMIQIHYYSNVLQKKIIPHIRMEGNWETMRHGTYGIDLDIKENVFFDVKLRIFNERVELFLNGNSYLDWLIPTNSDIPSIKTSDEPSNTKEEHPDPFVPKIHFRESYGRVGFRAYQGENAVIKDLFVKRLPGIL